MTCEACGATTTRGTVTFGKHGEVTAQHCVSCRPDLYEGPVRMPSDKKLWMGWEYMPNRYKKTEDADGPILMATDELQQDTADAISKPSEEALRSRQLEEALIAKKRATRRTAPMNNVEFNQAMNMADNVAKQIMEYHEKKHATI